MQVRIRPSDNRSGSNQPFQVGAIIEDYCGHRFGVVKVEQADEDMSRYTLISCVNGSRYQNMPHYTMKQVKPSTPDMVQLAVDTLAEWEANG